MCNGPALATTRRVFCRYASVGAEARTHRPRHPEARGLPARTPNRPHVRCNQRICGSLGGVRFRHRRTAPILYRDTRHHPSTRLDGPRLTRMGQSPPSDQKPYPTTVKGQRATSTVTVRGGRFDVRKIGADCVSCLALFLRAGDDADDSGHSTDTARPLGDLPPIGPSFAVSHSHLESPRIARRHNGRSGPPEPGACGLWPLETKHWFGADQRAHTISTQRVRPMHRSGAYRGCAPVLWMSSRVTCQAIPRLSDEFWS
jgi:hypothetical protein